MLINTAAVAEVIASIQEITQEANQRQAELLNLIRQQLLTQGVTQVAPGAVEVCARRNGLLTAASAKNIREALVEVLEQPPAINGRTKAADAIALLIEWEVPHVVIGEGDNNKTEEVKVQEAKPLPEGVVTIEEAEALVQAGGDRWKIKVLSSTTGEPIPYGKVRRALFFQGKAEERANAAKVTAKIGTPKVEAKPEARKLANKELATLLRGMGVNPTGQAWKAAKGGERNAATLTALNTADGVALTTAVTITAQLDTSAPADPRVAAMKAKGFTAAQIATAQAIYA